MITDSRPAPPEEHGKSLFIMAERRMVTVAVARRWPPIPTGYQHLDVIVNTVEAEATLLLRDACSVI